MADAIIAIITLTAYRHFTIIGNLGTGVAALCIVAHTKSNLEKSNPKPVKNEKETEEVQKENKSAQQEPLKETYSLRK